MKKIWRQSYCGTVEGLAAIFAMLVLLSGCEAPDPDQMLSDARASLALGDERSALIHVQNFLRGDPNHVEGRLLRADIALSLGDGAMAEKDLLRAQQSGVPAGDLVVRLGRAIAMQGAYERVIANIHTGAASDEPSRLKVLFLRGSAYLAMDRIDSAEQAFRQIEQADPESVDAATGLARVALARGNTERAIRIVTAALRNSPHSAAVWQAQGVVQSAAGNLEQARDAFLNASRIEPLDSVTPGNIETINGLFKVYLALDKPDDASALVGRILENDPGHPLIHFLMGEHALKAGDYRTASDHLLRTLAVLPGHLGALSLMGSMRLEQGNHAEAETFLSQAIAADPENPGLRMLQARTMLKLQQGDAAMEVLEPVLDDSSELPELLALAGAAKRVSGDRSDWLSYFERAAAVDPGNPDWQLQLARAYLAAGDAEKSVAVLRGLIADVETARTRDVVLIEAYSRNDQLTEALELGARLLERDPSNAPLRLLIGDVHWRHNNLDEARSIAAAVLEDEPGNIDALQLSGRVETRAGRLEQAESFLRRAYTLQPDNLRTVSLLALLASRRGDTHQAIDWFEAARETNPADMLPYIALVSLYLQNDDVSSAHAAARQALVLDAQDPRALTALGLTRIRREEFGAAVDTLKEAVLKAPDSGLARFALGEAYRGLGDEEEAYRSLRRAAQLAPRRVSYAVAAAEMALQTGNAGEAAAIAEALTRNVPDHVDGYRLLGDALVPLNRFGEAAAAYARATELDPTEALAVKRYQAMVRSGQQRQARSILMQWLGEHPEHWRVRLIVAELLRRDGRSERAIEHYEHIAAGHPDNAVVLNNLAWAYDQVGDERALELAEQAYRLRPGAAAFSDTLGWMLVRYGDAGRGRDLLRKAVRQAPAAGEIRYHLAHALATAGEVDEARVILSELLDSGNPFESMEQARALMKQL